MNSSMQILQPQQEQGKILMPCWNLKQKQKVCLDIVSYVLFPC